MAMTAMKARMKAAKVVAPPKAMKTRKLVADGRIRNFLKAVAPPKKRLSTKAEKEKVEGRGR